MYSAVENDTQCVPICNRWRLKAEYHVERSGNSMPRGRILELKNNYGIIDTDAYKVEHEWIPFRIEKSMLEEKEGKQYIKYTDEVEFSLSQSQGVRDRDIKEATDIRFIGDEWKYQERIIENNAIQNIKKRLSEYNSIIRYWMIRNLSIGLKVITFNQECWNTYRREYLLAKKS